VDGPSIRRPKEDENYWLEGEGRGQTTDSNGIELLNRPKHTQCCRVNIKIYIYIYIYTYIYIYVCVCVCVCFISTNNSNNCIYDVQNIFMLITLSV
jgi:hypothetical protein